MVIKISWIFWGNFTGIMLFPFMIVKHRREETVRHERIHFKQCLETYIIGFYLIYLAEWIMGVIKHRNLRLAYLEVRFEREAYLFDTRRYYLDKRKPYKWRCM